MNRSSALPLARLIALGAPALLLGGALASQYIGGLYPCEMCLWQRWPHAAAILLALGAFATRPRAGTSRLLTALAALGIALSGTIGVFHAGVEYGWWEGITACSVPIAGGSAQDMLDAIMAAPLTRCDVAPWSLFGISLAGFNALFSLAAAALIAACLLRARKD